MRITDLYESNDHQEDINTEIMNVIMMYHKADADKTDVNNIISELKKNDIVVTEQDIIDFVENNDTLSLGSDNKIVLDTSGDSSEEMDIPNVDDAEEYNPAKDKAKKATLKRLEK